MKTLLTIALALLCTMAKSQNKIDLPMDKDSSVVFMNEFVLNDTSQTKQLLYNKAKTWFANTYNDANRVIQIDDPINGHILGKGIYITPTGLLITYTIEVNIRQSKYRVVIHDAYFKYNEYHTESVTGVYKDYLSLLVKNEKKADRLYHYRLSQAYVALFDLQAHLGVAMMAKATNEF